MSVPRWMTKLPELGKQYTVPLALTVVGGGLIAYWWFQPLATPPTPIVKPVMAMPGQGTKEAENSKRIHDAQTQAAEEKLRNDDLAKTLRTLEKQMAQGDKKREEDDALRKQEWDTRAVQLESKMTQVIREAVTKATQQAKPATKPSPETKKAFQPKLSIAPEPPQASQPSQRGGCRPGALCIFGEDQKAGPFVLDKSLTGSQEAAYLTAPGFARVRLVTGAGGQANRALPILLSVMSPYYGPAQLRGVGNPNTPTAVPIEGCLVMAAGQANLSSQRVEGKLDTLGCVMADGHALEESLQGYLVGNDGQFGIFGKVQKHDSAAEAKAFLTAIIQEASAAIGIARSAVVVTGSGGPQLGSGVQNGMQELLRFYLQQMSQLVPTVTIASGGEGWMVLQRGVKLEGLAANTILIQRGE